MHFIRLVLVTAWHICEAPKDDLHIFANWSFWFFEFKIQFWTPWKEQICQISVLKDDECRNKTHVRARRSPSFNYNDSSKKQKKTIWKNCFFDFDKRSPLKHNLAPSVSDFFHSVLSKAFLNPNAKIMKPALNRVCCY